MVTGSNTPGIAHEAHTASATLEAGAPGVPKTTRRPLSSCTVATWRRPSQRAPLRSTIGPSGPSERPPSGVPAGGLAEPCQHRRHPRLAEDSAAAEDEDVRAVVDGPWHAPERSDEKEMFGYCEQRVNRARSPVLAHRALVSRPTAHRSP